jgi:hypothetical protein
MRKLLDITTPILPAAPAGRSYDRRPVRATFAGVTCIVLVKHRESESGKALYVSDDGDVLNAVPVPKAMLGLDKKDRGRFLVATMPKTFAAQKKLDQGNFTAEWCERLLPEERAQFAEAQDAAKRVRDEYRALAGYRTPMSRSCGRNEFA